MGATALAESLFKDREEIKHQKAGILRSSDIVMRELMESSDRAQRFLAGWRGRYERENSMVVSTRNLHRARHDGQPVVS